MKEKRNLNDSVQKNFVIAVTGKLVPVSQEVYQAYYRVERHLRTLEEKDLRNGRVLYSNLDTDELLGEEMLFDPTAPSVESIAITRILRDKLQTALHQLPKEEYELIQALYFEGKSERKFSQQTGTAPMTIHNRKVRVLKKLKKILEGEKTFGATPL